MKCYFIDQPLIQNTNLPCGGKVQTNEVARFKSVKFMKDPFKISKKYQILLTYSIDRSKMKKIF